MKNVKRFIKGLKRGLTIVVDYMEKVAFENKVSRGICWIITIMVIPFSLVNMLIMTIFNKHYITEQGDKAEQELRDYYKNEA